VLLTALLSTRPGSCRQIPPASLGLALCHNGPISMFAGRATRTAENQSQICHLATLGLEVALVRHLLLLGRSNGPLHESFITNKMITATTPSILPADTTTTCGALAGSSTCSASFSTSLGSSQRSSPLAAVSHLDSRAWSPSLALCSSPSLLPL
jgi:hypothetical protein